MPKPVQRIATDSFQEKGEPIKSHKTKYNEPATNTLCHRIR